MREPNEQAAFVEKGLDIPSSVGVVGVIGQIGHSLGNLNRPLERMWVGGMSPQVTVFFGPRAP